jgi:transposase InsO family protein
MPRRPDDERQAIFWCTLLEPVLFDELDAKAIRRALREISRTACTFPDGTVRKPSITTLRRKLARFREGGIDALYRQPRSDRGSRKHDAAVIERAVAIKRDLPTRSDKTINDFLRAESKREIPRSTLYRYLKRAGVTKLKLDLGRDPVRKRFTRDHTHDLWVGDFEHGPYVMHDGRAVATRLSGWIDCHSRFLVEGRYYLRESLDVVVDSLLRALVVHGLPKAIFVDNAKVYHADQLLAACYGLGVRPLHRRPRDPATGGLIERFFLTAQQQFEAEVRAGDIFTLDQLNDAFRAWLSVSYHGRVHTETKQSPRARYDTGLAAVRRVDLATALRFFLKRETRVVHRDFADVQLHGNLFRVDRRLRGDKVEVRFDPFSTPLDEVLVYTLDGVYAGKGTRHGREEGETSAPSPMPKPTENYLALLTAEHAKRLKRETAGGIDYCRARANHPYPIHAMLATLSELLGRKGGVSAFTTDEHEALEKLYHHHPDLDRRAVVDAVERADPKTLLGFARAVPVVLRERKETR